MQVRLVSTLEQLAALENAWAGLTLDRPFLSPAWLAVWWRYLGARHDCRLAVLVVEDDHRQPVAIAPWYLETSLLHGRTLRFLGSGEVCSEYLSIPCRAGYERRAAVALAEWLAGRGDDNRMPSLTWDLLSLEGVCRHDAVIGHLCRALASRGALTHATAATSTWRLQLPQSWDEYLAQLSKSHRKRVRRLERAYFDTGRARLVTAHSPAQRAVGFRLLVTMHEQRWRARGLHGSFHDAAVQSFHHQATSELQSRGQLRLNWLELDGRPVAAEYSLVGGGVVYGYQSGMDPAASEHEPGSLALIATLRLAIEEGMQVMDFLRGDEPYKQHWRAEPHATLNVRVLPNRWHGRFRHAAWQAANRTRGWLRSGKAAVRTWGQPAPQPAPEVPSPLGRPFPVREVAPQEQPIGAMFHSYF